MDENGDLEYEVCLRYLDEHGDLRMRSVKYGDFENAVCLRYLQGNCNFEDDLVRIQIMIIDENYFLGSES